MGTQSGDGLVQDHADVGDALAQAFGDSAVVEIIAVAQDDRGALQRRQAGHRLPQAVRLERRTVRWSGLGDLLGQWQRMATTQVVETEVAHDRAQPAADVAAVAGAGQQRTGLATQAQEGLLDGVLGHIGVAGDGVGHPQQVSLMAVDELGEGVHVSPDVEAPEEIHVAHGVGYGVHRGIYGLGHVFLAAGWGQGGGP